MNNAMNDNVVDINFYEFKIEIRVDQNPYCRHLNTF